MRPRLRAAGGRRGAGRHLRPVWPRALLQLEELHEQPDRGVRAPDQDAVPYRSSVMNSRETRTI